MNTEINLSAMFAAYKGASVLPITNSGTEEKVFAIHGVVEWADCYSLWDSSETGWRSTFRSFKLLLTPLSKISDADAIEVAKLATNRKLPHYGVDEFYITKNENSISIVFVDDQDIIINIDFGGDVLVYNDGLPLGEPFIEKRHSNQSAIIDYFRSATRLDGTVKPVYDLGYMNIKSLIEAGYAIDATKQ